MQFAVECAAAYAELFCGEGAIAAGFFQGADNQLLFRLRNAQTFSGI